jgi:hypothetical protein
MDNNKASENAAQPPNSVKPDEPQPFWVEWWLLNSPGCLTVIVVILIIMAAVLR